MKNGKIIFTDNLNKKRKSLPTNFYHEFFYADTLTKNKIKIKDINNTTDRSLSNKNINLPDR
jgi:hypothetical protein